MHRHYREVVGRITYWTSEPPSVVRSLIDHVMRRSRELDLRVGGLEASTLIELTAFGTAVAMQYPVKLVGQENRWRTDEHLHSFSSMKRILLLCALPFSVSLGQGHAVSPYARVGTGTGTLGFDEASVKTLEGGVTLSSRFSLGVEYMDLAQLDGVGAWFCWDCAALSASDIETSFPVVGRRDRIGDSADAG